MSAQKNLSKPQFGDSFGDDEDPPEMVRTDALMPHREWDLSGHATGTVRSMSPSDTAVYAEKNSPEEWDALRSDIRANGIRSPLRLSYDAKAHRGFLGEGNHRLQIAHEEGIESVPVVGNKGSDVHGDTPGYQLPDPGIRPEEHVSQQFKVSRVLPKSYMA